MPTYNLRGIIRQVNEGTGIHIKKFKHLLSSTNRLKLIRSKAVSLQNILILILNLIKINPFKFWVTFMLFVGQLGLTVSSPFISKYIIDHYLSESSEDISFFWLVLIILSYKLTKSLVNLVCDFGYTSVGYEYFARVYWHILDNYYTITGKILNLIEYDCSLIGNLTYAFLTALFDLLQILVLLSLMISYLLKTPLFTLFVSLVLIYLVSNIVINYFTFTFSRNYLNQKDRRLSFNITNCTMQELVKQRQKELVFNRRFLYLKIVSKLVSLLFPTLINLYVFVWTDRSYIMDEQYIILILINLIKNPINQLLFTANMMVEIIYSCRRIINFAATVFQEIENENKLSQSMLQDGAQPSIRPVLTSIADVAIKSAHEKGLISIGLIRKYIMENVSFLNVGCLIMMILMVLLGKYYNFQITKNIIAQKYSSFDFIGLAYQIIIPLLFYLTLISFSQKIAYSIFHRIKSKNLDCEYINRISGDITSIDRNITTNSYQLVSSVTFLLSSYLFSILSINQLWIQAVLLIFFGICIYIAFRINRFVMKSRRQVIRSQCFLKSSIIKHLLKTRKISKCKSMRKSWRNIFECKQMGLFIEIYYMCILSAIMLLLSLGLIILSQYLDIPTIDKSILFIACMNIDYDMLSMFFSAVRLQLSLVSFERVLNAIGYE